MEGLISGKVASPRGKAERERERERGEADVRNGGGILVAADGMRSCSGPLGVICEERDLANDELLGWDEAESRTGDEEGGLRELCDPAEDTLCWVCLTGKWRA